VAAIMTERGYALVNLDATVIAEAPPLAPHLDVMRGRIAAVLGAPVESVSVKAKSTDGLGSLGRGDGIAAQASVLLGPRP
jgi:2-C-methyl-D-erythritol 2,4-cyclodiphosphate synthase